jgi:DEAD/DEAH box helicase domain-containing protein
VRTLAFIRSRRGAEQVAMTAADLLAEVDPSLPARVASYRGGYLPEERRAIEEALRRGDLTGLAADQRARARHRHLRARRRADRPASPAPAPRSGSRSAAAGRDGQDALGVLVARDDPLDTYLVSHPEALLGKPVEASVFDPSNPYVLGPHLCASRPRGAPDRGRPALFGPTLRARSSTPSPTGGLLRRARAAGSGPTGGGQRPRRPPLDRAAHRCAADRGRRPAASSAPSTPPRDHGTAHAGAVYSTAARNLAGALRSDLEDRVAVIERAEPDYSTTAREVTDIAISAGARARPVGRLPASRLGDVDVSPRSWSLPQATPSRAARCSARSRSTCQCRAAAHHGASVGPFPRRARRRRARRGDLPGPRTPPSTARSACCRSSRPATGGTSAASRRRCTRHRPLTVFVYDGHPGGAGFAERGLPRRPAWLTATRDTIAPAAAPRAARRASSRPSAATRTTPSTRPGRPGCSNALLGPASA